jgi:putative restriction endonuclease
VRLDQKTIGLEAAHIKWHQAGGPDIEPNGMALCTLHHKLFDRGAFTLSDRYRVEVSERAHGQQGLAEWLLTYHGREIRKTVRNDYAPGQTFVDWHRSEVFRSPGRES